MLKACEVLATLVMGRDVAAVALVDVENPCETKVERGVLCAGRRVPQTTDWSLRRAHRVLGRRADMMLLVRS